MKIGILGIPFNGDGTRPETENPAAALREAGISTLSLGQGHRLIDHGDLEIPAFSGIRDPETQILNREAWQAISLRTAEKLGLILKNEAFTLILGGDCSILLGIYGAFRQADLRVGLLILDGHTDYREPALSLTGEPADLELAILTGKGPEPFTGLFGAPPLVQAQDVVVCGYREPDFIAESNIHHVDCRCFRKNGAETSAILALERLGHLDRLWVHLDVDVLDPAVMPVCFPEAGGLSPDEIRVFLSTAICSKTCMGISLACYHPDLDPGRLAASRLVTLLGSVLSASAGAQPPGNPIKPKGLR